LGITQSDDVSAEIADVSETERKRREAVWELFRSECVFLIDHLMVLKHVSKLETTTRLNRCYFSRGAVASSPHFCLRLFVRFLQIRRVLTGESVTPDHNLWRMKQICCFHWTCKSLKVFSFRGITPDAEPLDSVGGFSQTLL